MKTPIKALYTGWLQNKEVFRIPVVVTEILPPQQGSDLYCKAYLEEDPTISGVLPVKSYALGQIEFTDVSF